LTRHPEAGAVFNGGMANFSELENPPIAASYDFPPRARVIDVGGGRGGFIAEVLKAHATLRGVLYDLPEVVRDAAYVRAAGVADRCVVRSGDLLASVEQGGGAYGLCRIMVGV